jgi:hypothetical protein
VELLVAQFDFGEALVPTQASDRATQSAGGGMSTSTRPERGGWIDPSP